jgi:hypothetical protein
MFFWKLIFPCRSVVGSFLHNSLWPSILRSDSATTRGVPTKIILIVKSRIFILFLLSIAASVTPLGLYQAIRAASNPTYSSFHYIADDSEFGYGTPPRTDLAWSRICGSTFPVPCPNSFTQETLSENPDGAAYDVQYYDSAVPQYVVDVFESGLATMAKSVSSIFDIQSRSYTWSVINDNVNATAPDNGASYPLAAFRQISTLVLEDDYVLVEGLIVDMTSGAIGFRNHSAPPVTPFGSVWSEDILFIEPESACVDTNLTVDFMLPVYNDTLSSVVNLVLTDRGGFANLNHTYPEWDRSAPQQNPELYARAYKAAWINNAYSMVFMNVTNFRNESDPHSRAFEYLKSSVGQTFPLMYSNVSNIAGMTFSSDQLLTSTAFGQYLIGLDQEIPGSNFTSIFGGNDTVPATPPLYTNPFGITGFNFSDAGKLTQNPG